MRTVSVGALKRMSHYLNVVRLFVAELFTKYTSYKSKECDVLLFFFRQLSTEKMK